MTGDRDLYGFRFREWDIYKDARLFRNEINIILKNYPREEIYALIDQTRRALNSIILNIAEGANKNTDKDTRVYINRAHCSLDEVVSCLDCALDDKYITQKQHEEAIIKASSLAKRLKGFTRYLS
ncbi:MAG: four helix bundle protein [bacterium]|nr:four helix bundle protein [bacterium]